MAVQQAIDKPAAASRAWREREVYARRYMRFAWPALAVISAVILFPWLFTIYMSLHDWQVGKPQSFIGLDNYVALFGDARFLEAILRTLYYTVLAVALPV